MADERTLLTTFISQGVSHGFIPQTEIDAMRQTKSGYHMTDLRRVATAHGYPTRKMELDTSVSTSNPTSPIFELISHSTQPIPPSQSTHPSYMTNPSVSDIPKVSQNQRPNIPSLNGIVQRAIPSVSEHTSGIGALAISENPKVIPRTIPPGLPRLESNVNTAPASRPVPDVQYSRKLPDIGYGYSEAEAAKRNALQKEIYDVIPSNGDYIYTKDIVILLPHLDKSTINRILHSMLLAIGPVVRKEAEHNGTKPRWRRI